MTRPDITIGGTDTDLYNKVQAGTLDFVDDSPSEAPVLRTFKADPTLAKQISPQFTEDSTFYIAMNLTVRIMGLMLAALAVQSMLSGMRDVMH